MKTALHVNCSDWRRRVTPHGRAGPRTRGGASASASRTQGLGHLKSLKRTRWAIDSFPVITSSDAHSSALASLVKIVTGKVLAQKATGRQLPRAT
jgi:hypothetical protein